MDAMSPIAQLFALIAALLHVLFFYAESVTFARPATWRRFGLQTQEQADIVRPMAYNQGFYNLFLALGILGGLILVASGSVEAGRAVVVFACACMLLAGVVLITTSRAMLRAALLQLVPPLLAIIATFVL
jgi:putative membrane protein